MDPADVRVTTDGTNLVLDESPDLPMERQISPQEVGCWTWKIFDWLTFMLLLNIYGLKFSMLFSHGWPYQQLFSLPHMHLPPSVTVACNYAKVFSVRKQEWWGYHAVKSLMTRSAISAGLTNTTVRSTELGQHTPHFAIASHSKNFT